MPYWLLLITSRCFHSPHFIDEKTEQQRNLNNLNNCPRMTPQNKRVEFRSRHSVPRLNHAHSHYVFIKWMHVKLVLFSSNSVYSLVLSPYVFPQNSCWIFFIYLQHLQFLKIIWLWILCSQELATLPPLNCVLIFPIILFV